MTEGSLNSAGYLEFVSRMIDYSIYDNPTEYPSYETIKSKFSYFLDQLQRDTELSDLAKNNCMETICKIPMTTDLGIFSKLCNTEFFFKNKLVGEDCKGVLLMNPFIRINDLDAFVKWIAEITGINYPNVRVKLNEIIYAT